MQGRRLRYVNEIKVVPFKSRTRVPYPIHTQRCAVKPTLCDRCSRQSTGWKLRQVTYRLRAVSHSHLYRTAPSLPVIRHLHRASRRAPLPTWAPPPLPSPSFSHQNSCGYFISNFLSMKAAPFARAREKSQAGLSQIRCDCLLNINASGRRRRRRRHVHQHALQFLSRNEGTLPRRDPAPRPRRLCRRLSRCRRARVRCGPGTEWMLEGWFRLQWGKTKKA